MGLNVRELQHQINDGLVECFWVVAPQIKLSAYCRWSPIWAKPPFWIQQSLSIWRSRLKQSLHYSHFVLFLQLCLSVMSPIPLGPSKPFPLDMAILSKPLSQWIQLCFPVSQWEKVLSISKTISFCFSFLPQCVDNMCQGSWWVTSTPLNYEKP